MCEYCGCREVAPVAELMDEHTALVDEASYVRHDLGVGDAGEFVEEIDELEGEHRDFATRVTALLDDLDAHVEREDLGIFPVSVVTLGSSGWATVDDARRNSPSFLLDVSPNDT